jgi:uncharacterized XkdX family phage protein
MLMFEMLKHLYKDKKVISKKGLKKAVSNGYITAEEYEEITGEAYR